MSRMTASDAQAERRQTRRANREGMSGASRTVDTTATQPTQELGHTPKKRRNPSYLRRERPHTPLDQPKLFGKHIIAPMHSKQITQPGLSECTTMPKMRGLRPSHMHSMSMAKGQQQEQQQPGREEPTASHQQSNRDFFSMFPCYVHVFIHYK